MRRQRKVRIVSEDSATSTSNPVDDPRQMMPWQIVNERRKQLGLKQAEVASRLGYHYPNFVSMIESGQSPVPLGRAAEFARVLDLPETWFVAQVLRSRTTSDSEGLLEFLFGSTGKLRDAYERDLQHLEAGFLAQKYVE